MYAVCGATGNIGQLVTLKLLAEGKTVRVIGRSAERLQPLVDKGAKAYVADLTDTKALTKAFKGAKAVYAMIPPNLTTTDVRGYQNEIGKSVAEAITGAGVKHVVNLSSVGAHMTDGVGVVNGLHDQEVRLNGLKGVNVIHLRPASFMENHLWQLNTIKEKGTIFTPQNLDTKLPQIATSDIADYAVARMTNLDFQGKISRELLGPTDVSMNEVATAIGRAIGKDHLDVVRVSWEDTRNSMIGMGVSDNVADGMMELYQAIDTGVCTPTETRTPENTTPTTIDTFSTTFTKLYKG